MKNWKTTIAGYLGAASIPLIANGDPRFHYAGLGLAALASILLGHNAQDAIK